MATLILVRHGRTAANVDGVLAGRAPGVALDDVGRSQAAAAAERLAEVPIVELVSSPLQRCRQTAELIAARRRDELSVVVEPGITECDYGRWQGRRLAELAREQLWRQVQAEPASVVFPGGESIAAMRERAVTAVARHDAAVTDAHGRHAVWVAVSHADVIKAILADALGLSLDRFQRIGVEPGSISVVHYGEDGARVIAMNTIAGDLSRLAAGVDEAPAVGGGAGAAGSAGRDDA
jgi:probable phosphomutase (TIGR03848 family)